VDYCNGNQNLRGDGGARFELEEQVQYAVLKKKKDCDIHTKTETLSLQILVLQLLLIALHGGRLYCQEGDVLCLDWAELL
jgi:hypothetical protein